MAFIPVPNVIQTELVYLWGGQRVQNVLHYLCADTPTISDMENIGAAIVSWFNSDMDLLMTQFAQLQEIKMFSMESAIAPGITYTTGLPLPGLITATDSLPNNVAVVITKRTELRGRSYRGRIYQIGLVESQVNHNHVSPTPLLNILAAWEDIRIIVDGEDAYTMVVVSRYTEGSPRTTGLATPITNFSSDGVIDSQRRRLPGRGS